MNEACQVNELWWDDGVLQVLSPPKLLAIFEGIGSMDGVDSFMACFVQPRNQTIAGLHTYSTCCSLQIKLFVFHISNEAQEGMM